MSIWSRLFGREKRAMASIPGFSRNTIEFADSNLSATHAMRLAAVWSCVDLIASQIATLPLHNFRADPNGHRLNIDLPPLFKTSPSPNMTRKTWLYQAMSSLLLRGNAYGLLRNFDYTGYPTEVEWVHPDLVTINETAGVPLYYINGIYVESSRIVHIPWAVFPGSVIGLSPINAFKVSLETGLSAIAYGRDFFRNSSLPSGLITSEKPNDVAGSKFMKEQFKIASAGRDIVAVPKGISFQQLSIPAEESQFLQTISATATQIAAIYHVDPERVGGETGHSLTYATTEQNNHNFLTFTLRPWIATLEAAFDVMTARGQEVRFNIDAFLRADLKTRYEAHKIALDTGFLSINEVRSYENKPPVAGGDQVGIRTDVISPATRK